MGKTEHQFLTRFIDVKEVKQSIPVAYLTSFRYYLLDESTISEQQAARLKGAYAAMILANRSKRRGDFAANINQYIDLIEEGNPEVFESFCNWFITMLGRKPDAETIRKIAESGKGGVKNMLADIGRELKAEGRAEGMERGLQQGMQRGVSETARRMLAKGLSVDLIQEVTSLSKDAIAALRQQG